MVWLKLGAPDTINCKVYPLACNEIQATAEFTKKNEELGRIRKVNSPWGSPFFIKKKDGSLRPVQDYRAVNSWTERDVYPMPRIEQILEQLHGKVLFMTLDIRDGYNNICMRTEDQWKLAFKLLDGTYAPQVMFFRMTNAPAVFQHTMDRIFAVLKNKFPRCIFIYIVTIHFLFCLILLILLCLAFAAPFRAVPRAPPLLLLLLSASAGSHVTDDVSLLTDSASGARHHDYLAD